MDTMLLLDMIKVLALAAGALLICSALRAPGLVGLMIVGVVCGPHGLALIEDADKVETMAEIGVVLLLFTIGLEFSLTKLAKMGRAAVLGGGMQTAGTIALAALCGVIGGQTIAQGIFLGFLVSLSSTAIVLKTMQGRGEVDSPHGRLTIAILIFQDLAVVGMILLTPSLAGQGGNLLGGLALIVAKLIGVGVVVVIAAKYVMPRLLFHVMRTRNRELFMLTTVLILMITPWMATELGLSTALGAFMAGLMISETEYSHQTMSGFIPLRDVFTSLFFVSIGMLLDFHGVLAHPLAIVLGSAGLILLKTLAAGGAVLILRYPLRTAILAGLGLAQIGEFSFILAKSGLDGGLMGDGLFQIFIAVSIVSMAATPLLIAIAPRIAEWAQKKGGKTAARLEGAPQPDETRILGLFDHVIIIGFGHSGRNLARSLNDWDVPYVIIEMNAETVRREGAKGERILFGDASQEAVLEQAHPHTAQTLVVSLPDLGETRSIVRLARKLNPNLTIVARTRFAGEVGTLREMGADSVISDECEAALALASSVLHKRQVPEMTLNLMVESEREGGYAHLREPMARE